MSTELDNINKILSYKNITITSLEKLDNGYIRIVGKNNKYDVDIITNGSTVLDFKSYREVDSVFSYNGLDYVIAVSYWGLKSLIGINDGKVLVKDVTYIFYLEDGLLGISTNDKKSSLSPNKVFDLLTKDYVPILGNLVLSSYKDGLLSFEEKEEGKDRKSTVVKRSGEVIIPLTPGFIRIVNKTKFIINNHELGDSVIDLNQQVVIEKSDIILPINNEQIMLLKNRKLHILNNNLETIKTYEIGETIKPWFTSVRNGEVIMMSFKKKKRNKKYEPRKKYDLTIVIDLKTEQVIKLDFIPKLSKQDVFVVSGKENKKGLMRKTGEMLLPTEYDNGEALKDSKNKYFYLKKDDEYFIFNAESKQFTKVLYTQMIPYKDGLAIGFHRNPVNYELLDEELNPIFNLKHMGHQLIYYDNGYLCYHTGNFYNNYDAYTIVHQNGDVIMPSKECQVIRNGFGILEIRSKDDSKVEMFNPKTGEFLNLNINLPVVETDNGRNLDYSVLTVQNLIASGIPMPLLESENGDENGRKYSLQNKEEID